MRRFFAYAQNDHPPRLPEGAYFATEGSPYLKFKKMYFQYNRSSVKEILYVIDNFVLCACCNYNYNNYNN